SIATQPQSQSVIGGSSLALTVAATGTAPLTYQWKKDGNNVAGATTSTLSVSQAQAGDAGTYSVVVTNSLGSVTSNPAVVTVSSDVFANRVIIPSGGVNTLASNAAATKESGEPNHAGSAGGKSVWWTWTAPNTGAVTVDTLGSSFDTVLAIYTGG